MSTYPKPGAVVETKGKGAPFVIEAAGNGQYEVCLATLSGVVGVNVILTSYRFKIKLQNSDLLWNVEPPIIPRGEVCSHSPCFFFLLILFRSNSAVLTDMPRSVGPLLLPSRIDLFSNPAAGDLSLSSESGYHYIKCRGRTFIDTSAAVTSLYTTNIIDNIMII